MEVAVQELLWKDQHNLVWANLFNLFNLFAAHLNHKVILEGLQYLLWAECSLTKINPIHVLILKGFEV